MLTIMAPKLDDAHRMALRFIEENGEEGGRAVEKEEQENQKKDNKKRPWCGQNWKGWSGEIPIGAIGYRGKSMKICRSSCGPPRRR